MTSWILYALATAFFWGIYSVISRVITSPKYFSLEPHMASLLMLCGASVVFVVYFLSRYPNASLLFKLASLALICAIFFYTFFAIQEQGIKFGWPLFTAGISQGLFWAAGMVSLYMALSTGVAVGKIASLYNLNLLVTILLSVMVLHELPRTSEQVKLLIGGGFIILGGIIAGM